MHNIIKLHGIPKFIASDRDKVFTGQFWQIYSLSLCSALSLSTPSALNFFVSVAV